MTITLVAAVGRNGVLGRSGDLPWARTGDLAHFKQLTMGHVLVMGRRTYESIGRPLPGRTTVVVTRQPEWPAPDGVLVASNVTSALQRASEVADQVFVIGGGQVFAATLSAADRIVLTEVDQAPDGDVYFPAVDWSQWQETAREPHSGFTIVTFDRASSERTPLVG